MPIRTLIVDDEPRALEVIKKYVVQIPQLELLATYTSALQAFHELKKNHVDLMFLDINMPGLLGTDLVRSLQKPPLVVFTTAHQEYAIDGFNLNAVDYLLKPIPFDRFLRAVDKVLSRCQQEPAFAPMSEIRPADIPKSFYVYIRIDRQLVKLDTDDILWLESDKDYIKVVTKEKVYLTKQKISSMENLLPIRAFLRVHRSFIVPISKVTGYNPNYLMVANARIPIGRNYKQICLEEFSPGNLDVPIDIN